MNDRITPEGCCTTCGKELSEFEVYHEICISCGGYPMCGNCGGTGEGIYDGYPCKKCGGDGIIKPEKQSDI